MAEIPTVVCRACQRPTRMEQVTFDSEKKAYVCNSCHGKVRSPSPIKKAVEEKPGIFGGKVPVKEPMSKYACLKCKYKFTRPKGKVVSTCPYCGGQKVEEVTNDASKILADSDKYDF